MTGREAPPRPAPPAVGWYGKLPARGDFVSHGLPPEHLRVWDGWLQRGLDLAAGRWAPHALAQHLKAFPPWRFLAWPDGENSAPCAGVLVASHDRVGRSFPLIVCQFVEPATLDATDWLEIEAALARLADAALDATDPQQNAAREDFESVLRSTGPILADSPPPLDAPPRQQSPRAMLRNGAGIRSLWWSEPLPGASPLPLADAWPPHDELLLDILGTRDEPA